MFDKLELTKKLIADSEIWTVNDAMQDWWKSPNGGWRLTAVGFEALVQYKLEHWEFDTSRFVISPGLLLVLDRKLTAPYYLHMSKNSRISFFSGKEATMYALYNDIKRFVTALQQY